MSFQDKSIQCSDCGATFTFSVEEQELFQSKGYTNEPKRCTPCRQARKSAIRKQQLRIPARDVSRNMRAVRQGYRSAFRTSR